MEPIPRVIHCCWFGHNSKPALMRRCQESWGRLLPNYQIREWTEDNFDLSTHPYLVKHYEKRDYAFVSDLVRLMVLYQHGGLYFDTDLEVKKPLDRFLSAPLFLGFMFDCALGTALIGARPGHPILGELMRDYSSGMEDCVINNTLFTRYFLTKVPGFKLDGSRQTLVDGTEIYPRQYFEFPTWNPRKGFCRHHAMNSWKSTTARRPWVKALAQRLMGDALYLNFAHRRILRRNEFYSTYKNFIDKR